MLMPSHISLFFSKVNLNFWEEWFWFSLNNFVIDGSQAVGHEPAWLLILCWTSDQPVEEIVERYLLELVLSKDQRILFRFSGWCLIILYLAISALYLSICIPAFLLVWYVRNFWFESCVRNIELVTFGLNSCCHVVVLTSPPPEHVWKAIQLPGHTSRWIQSGYMEGFKITWIVVESGQQPPQISICRAIYIRTCPLPPTCAVGLKCI